MKPYEKNSLTKYFGYAAGKQPNKQMINKLTDSRGILFFLNVRQKNNA